MKLETQPESRPSPELDRQLWVEAIPTFPTGGGPPSPALPAVRLLVCGDLDETTSPSMEAAALGALESVPELLVLDLSGVVFFDTAGLRSVVAIANTADRLGVRLLIGGMSGGVERLLELTGLLEQLARVERCQPHPN